MGVQGVIWSVQGPPQRFLTLSILEPIAWAAGATFSIGAKSNTLALTEVGTPSLQWVAIPGGQLKVTAMNGGIATVVLENATLSAVVHNPPISSGSVVVSFRGTI